MFHMAVLPPARRRLPGPRPPLPEAPPRLRHVRMCCCLRGNCR